MSPLMILKTSVNAIFLQELASGHSHYDELVGVIPVKCGPDPARANLSARQASEMGLLTSGTYGRTSTTSLKSAVLQLYLANKLQAATASVGSTLYNLTWKVRYTPSQRPIFALRGSVRRTSDKDSISLLDLLTGWQTPTTTNISERSNDAMESRMEKRLATGRTSLSPGSLAEQASMYLSGWVTPTTRDWKDTGGGYQATRGRTESLRSVATSSEPCGLADAECEQHQGAMCINGIDTEVDRRRAPTEPSRSSSIDGLADSGSGRIQEARRGPIGRVGESGIGGEYQLPYPTNGFWRSVDWLGCRDGKFRPVEPCTFPLVNGTASRVGRLRAYGNAINAENAITFIKAASDGLLGLDLI